jgi:hypothetical protein
MIIKSGGMTGYKIAVGIDRIANKPFLAMVEVWIPEGIDIVVPKTGPYCVIFYRSERAFVKNIVPYYDGFFLDTGDPIDWDHTATSLFEWNLRLNFEWNLRLKQIDPVATHYVLTMPPTLYKVGAEVVANTLDVSEDEACASGIHFFSSIKDAEIYFRDGWWPSDVIAGIQHLIKQH